MVISGRSKRSFEDANYATLRTKRVNGEWKSASTNESWDVFWSEVTAYDGDTVELAKLPGSHEIRSDGKGEYIQVSQEHNSLFTSGRYETRLRPYLERSTETKPWMGDENGTEQKASEGAETP